MGDTLYLVPSGDRYVVQTTWSATRTSFDLLVTDGQTVWSYRATRAVLDKCCEKSRLDEDVFREGITKALGGADPGFVCNVEVHAGSKQLQVSIVDENNSILLAKFERIGATSAETSQKEIFSMLNETIRLKTQAESNKISSDKLRDQAMKQHDDARKEIQKLTVLAVDRQRILADKYARLLNAKKKRIRKLSKVIVQGGTVQVDDKILVVSSKGRSMQEIKDAINNGGPSTASNPDGPVGGERSSNSSSNSGGGGSDKNKNGKRPAQVSDNDVDDDGDVPLVRNRQRHDAGNGKQRELPPLATSSSSSSSAKRAPFQLQRHLSGSLLGEEDMLSIGYLPAPKRTRVKITTSSSPPSSPIKRPLSPPELHLDSDGLREEMD